MKRPNRAPSAGAPDSPAANSRGRMGGGHRILRSVVGEAVTLASLEQNEFAHPWTLFDVAWREYVLAGESRAGWTFRIKPGFVNGIDPLAFGAYATGSASYVSMRGAASDLRRVGGALEFASSGTKQKESENLSKPDWYPLLKGPVIPVNGYTTSGPVPPFFKELGVQSVASNLAAAGIDINQNTGQLESNMTQSLLAGPKAAPRVLIGQDFWLELARARYESQVDLIGNLVTGQLVEYSVSFDTSELERTGGRPRVVQGDFAALARQRELARADLATRLGLGGPNDDGYDQQFLFTFWLLEPEVKFGNVKPKEPGPEWTPYIEYQNGGYGGGWWNFNHAAKNDPPFNARQLGSLGGLAALVGRYTIVPQATMGALEAEQQRILNAALNQTSNAGKFWT